MSPASTADMCNATATTAITFDPMMLSPIQCASIGIRGDNIVEDTETFDVVFTTTQDRVRIVDDTTTVTIIDDDGIYMN